AHGSPASGSGTRPIGPRLCPRTDDGRGPHHTCRGPVPTRRAGAGGTHAAGRHTPGAAAGPDVPGASPTRRSTGASASAAYDCPSHDALWVPRGLPFGSALVV